MVGSSSKKRKISQEEKEERKREKKRLRKEEKLKGRNSGEAEAPATPSRVESSPKPTSTVSAAEISTNSKSKLFLKRRAHLSVAILPASLGNIRESVKEALGDYLLRYIDGFDGILLAFQNLKILDDGKGRIFDRQPHILYEVTCDILVFNPLAGERLRGRVNQSFHSHLAIVAFDYFNANIPADEMRKCGFEFDQEEEHWYNTESLNVLDATTWVDFTIDRIQESGGIISIDGSALSVAQE